MIKIIRKIVFIIWILIITFFGYYISQHREYLEPQNLLIFFQSFGSGALILYILTSLIRGLILMPSLPIVLVGVLFFPGHSHLVFIISMFGIIFSGILIYKFSDFMGFDEMFAENVDNTRIKNVIEKYGFYAVTLWSFVPIVPTDLICYVAGTVQMKFWKFVTALALGEGLIVGIIVYGSSRMVKLLL